MLLTSWFLWRSAPCTPAFAVPSGDTQPVIGVAVAQTNVRVRVPAVPADGTITPFACLLWRPPAQGWDQVGIFSRVYPSAYMGSKSW